jgi:hypothetical protein
LCAGFLLTTLLDLPCFFFLFVLVAMAGVYHRHAESRVFLSEGPRAGDAACKRARQTLLCLT